MEAILDRQKHRQKIQEIAQEMETVFLSRTLLVRAIEKGIVKSATAILISCPESVSAIDEILSRYNVTLDIIWIKPGEGKSFDLESLRSSKRLKKIKDLIPIEGVTIPTEPSLFVKTWFWLKKEIYITFFGKGSWEMGVHNKCRGFELRKRNPYVLRSDFAKSLEEKGFHVIY